MPKYEVTLQSQTDSHSRRVTLSADSIEEARAICEEKEADLCAYELSNDEIALMNRSGFFIGGDGKVRGPSARGKARFHAHFQTAPYKVASIQEVQLDVDRLVRELAQLQQDEDKWNSTLDQLREAGLPIAAVTAFMYGVPVKNQYDGTAVVDFDTDTMKVALLTGHTPDQDTHDFFNDVSGNEVTGTGYTAGGATLGTKTATYDTASDQCRLDAADTSWSSSTISATHAVIYKSTGTGSTSPLMGLVDFGGTVSSSSGTFQITWDTTGIIVIDVT